MNPVIIKNILLLVLAEFFVHRTQLVILSSVLILHSFTRFHSASMHCNDTYMPSFKVTVVTGEADGKVFLVHFCLLDWVKNALIAGAWVWKCKEQKELKTHPKDSIPWCSWLNLLEKLQSTHKLRLCEVWHGAAARAGRQGERMFNEHNFRWRLIYVVFFSCHSVYVRKSAWNARCCLEILFNDLWAYYTI